MFRVEFLFLFFLRYTGELSDGSPDGIMVNNRCRSWIGHPQHKRRCMCVASWIFGDYVDWVPTQYVYGNADDETQRKRFESSILVDCNGVKEINYVPLLHNVLRRQKRRNEWKIIQGLIIRLLNRKY